MAARPPSQGDGVVNPPAEDVDFLFEDGGDVELLQPDHPRMARIQKALETELKRHEAQLDLQLREQKAVAADLNKKRQASGVELYENQQKLAAAQSNLESANESYAVVAAARKESERTRAANSAKLQLQLAQRDQKAKELIGLRKESEKVTAAAAAVDAYNDKVQAEIRVTRRDAYGTEDQMSKLEKAKAAQDFRADRLQEQLRATEEQSRALMAQTAAQKADLQQAKDALKESEDEMAKIEAEKTELVQKWKSTLIGMSNRDIALQAAHGALKQQNDKLLELDMGLEATKKMTNAERVKNEQQTAVVHRMEAELQYVEQQTAALAETRRELSAQFHIIREGIDKVALQNKSENQDGKELRAALDVLQRQYEKLVADKNAVDDQIMENINDQTTIEKGFQKLWADTQKLKLSIRAAEIEIGESENLLAKVKVETLKTSSHNTELLDNLKGLVANLKESDIKIGDYEKNIRRQNDKIEKRQLYMAQLNKSYEALMLNAVSEETGPLESTIHHLRTELLTVEKATTELQREWIQKQNELVNLVADTNQQQAALRSLQSKLAVLGQKRLRIDQEIERNKSEYKELGRAISQMTIDMKRLNEMISQNAKTADELSDANFNSETDFVRKLKDLEQNSVSNQVEVQRLEQEREILFADVIEAEKQILLWEKKVALERETQDTLNPSYGQVEIEGMKKEIHRMRLRYQQLMRQQEKMIQDMEKTVAKRDPISAVQAIIAKPTLKVGMTNAALKKKIQTSREDLKKAIADCREVEEKYSRQQEQNRQLAAEISSQQAVLAEWETKRAAMMRQYDDAKLNKRVNSEAVRQQQSAARRYEEAAEDRYQMTLTQERINAEATKAAATAEQVDAVLQRLKVEIPKYNHWFERLRRADQFE